jgi:cholesterol transport system auxiliary component
MSGAGMKKDRGMRAFVGIAGAGLLSLALGGCLGLGGGKPPPSLFSLTAARTAAAGAEARGTSGTVLMVMEPETDRRLAVQRVPVQVSASEVAYLKDAMWVERPARLFRSLLAETLRAEGKGLVLEDDQSAAPAAVRLGGRLVEMGYDARSQSAVVRYDALRTGPNGAVATRRFESVVPGVSARPESVAPALNRAANEVAAQVAAWMAG